MAWQMQRQNAFTGGENLKVLPGLSQPDQLIRAKNCVLNADGVVETRLGRVRVNTDTIGAGPILSLHLFATMAGVNYLIAQHGTSLYGVTWDGASTIASFGTAIKTGLTAASKLRSVVWKDNILFTNGVDNPFKWDGTTVADISGSPPKSHIIKIYASRAWLVDAANPNQVRYSDLENFDSWPALNVILVRDNDGDFIRGLSPQSGGLVIFKNNSRI